MQGSLCLTAGMRASAAVLCTCTRPVAATAVQGVLVRITELPDWQMQRTSPGDACWAGRGFWRPGTVMRPS